MLKQHEIPKPYKPVQVITVYRSTTDYYLESRNVMEVNNNFLMTAATPLTEETTSALIRSLGDAKKKTDSVRPKGLMPENMLYYKQDIHDYVFVWFEAARIQSLYFHKETGIKSGKANCPGFIFKLNREKLSVWAVRDKKVKLNTQLFHAPFSNITNGAVCLGNAKLPDPKEYLEDIMNSWGKAFFLSEFTSHGGADTAKLWNDLIGTKKSFPMKTLKTTGKTLKHIINLE